MSEPFARRDPPDPPLADDAVLLRVPRLEDAPAIAAACADPEIARWVPVPVPYSLADALAFLAIVQEGWSSGSHATFAIEDRATGMLAGMIGVDRGAVPGRASIGYWLAPSARGRGFATRAVRLASAWAFTDPRLERLELMTLVGNHASGRVALRAGFELEGVLRTYLSFRGRSVDAVMYARVRAEQQAGDAAGGAFAGTPGATLAHELRIPAATAQRCVARLGEALDEWDRASAALGALAAAGGPAAAPFASELLDTLREEVAGRATDPPIIDPIEAQDRRDAVATLLADLGMTDPAEPAAALVALGWDGNQLDDVLEPFDDDEARLVVAAWLAATGVVRQLLAKLGMATAGIAALLGAIRD